MSSNHTKNVVYLCLSIKGFEGMVSGCESHGSDVQLTRIQVDGLFVPFLVPVKDTFFGVGPFYCSKGWLPVLLSLCPVLWTQKVGSSMRDIERIGNQKFVGAAIIVSLLPSKRPFHHFSSDGPGKTLDGNVGLNQFTNKVGSYM